MLIGGLAGGAGVDEIAGFNTERYSLVNIAFPANASAGETVRVFVVKEGFRFAVAGLLLEVFSRSGTAVVPDEGGSRKA